MPTAFNLVWDADGERRYETGVDRGVIYQKTSGNDPYPKGVAWNGLTAANERPSGGDPSSYYADNIEYLKIRAAEKFGITIEAYTYPDEFAELKSLRTILAIRFIWFMVVPHLLLSVAIALLMRVRSLVTSLGKRRLRQLSWTAPVSARLLTSRSTPPRSMLLNLVSWNPFCMVPRLKVILLPLMADSPFLWKSLRCLVG